MSSAWDAWAKNNPDLVKNTTTTTGGNDYRYENGVRTPAGGGNSSSNSSSSLVKTNTSYNGEFLSIDNNVDYQSKINQAVKQGDYAAAAKYEAERNAKLIHLGRGNEVTNNYVSVYDKAPTNNQGGVTYSNSVKNILDLPSNWTSASVNGATYKKDANGNILQQTGGNSSGPTYTLVGNGLNSKTGEFIYNNASDARQAAYNSYISSGGNNSVSQDYALNNLIDGSFVDALMNGTVGEYISDVTKRARAAKEAELAKAKALAELKELEETKYYNFEYDYPSVAPTPVAPAPEESNVYEDYIHRLVNGNRVRIY